tara:strand:- start:145 stop:945 length:801 start_codon:yes stop_codon:yes gene_type:complete
MIQRNAQAFYLSSNQITAGVAPFNMTATAALPLLLDSMFFTGTFDPALTDSGALITALTLSGQSLLAFDQGFPLTAFLTNNNYAMEGINAIGLTIDTNQVIALTTDFVPLAAPSVVDPIGFSISTSPTDIVISPNASGSMLNFLAGMGRVVVPAAGGLATLQAVCLRDSVFLGRLVMDCQFAAAAASINPNQIQIRSIRVDGIELMSSINPNVDTTPLSVFQPNSNDKNGLQLNYTCSQNSIIQIDVVNNAAGPVSVNAGFFCKPM